MSPPFRAATFGASPSYPNSIAWSEENLIAVATGQCVRILNPEKPQCPRGVINLTAKDPFPLGTVDRKDTAFSISEQIFDSNLKSSFLVDGKFWKSSVSLNLTSPCLLPSCLARDRRPCVRSIAWSPPGFASNYGCLLAVCTTEGSVKIYSHPYFQFRAEWLEVMDVSDMLFVFLAKTNYGEAVFPLLSDASDTSQDLSIQVFTGNAADVEKSATSRVSKKRKCDKKSDSLESNIISLEGDLTKTPASVVPEAAVHPVSILQPCSSAQVHKAGSSKEGNPSLQIVPATTGNGNLGNGQQDCGSKHLAADIYASRCALISSLVVVWSPLVTLSAVGSDNLSSSYCLLAVGAKSGHISLWRVHGPDTYSVERRCASRMTLAGFQKIHDAWVTTLAWGLIALDDSNPKLLLASGSSTGSVKIWLGDGEDMLRSTEANPASFSLLTKVAMDDAAPISVLSLTRSEQFSSTMVLAIGKGSGSVEVWTFDLDGKDLKTVGSYAMHDHIVTGLAWAFGGRYLYSSSQDNSMRVWMFHKESLTEVPFPPNNLSTKSSADLPCVCDSCFGVAVSPGNLVAAVVRCFDADVLHPMYQARNQKAAIEFFWIGGQQQSMLSESNLELDVDVPPAFTNEELVSWAASILWSLKQYNNHNKHLVVWDIVTALSAFKQCVPTFLDQILSRWLVFLGGCSDLLTGKSALSACRSLSKVCSRQLHLLNILCRRVILPHLNADKVDAKHPCSVKPSNSEQQLWMKLLLSSEEELRERLAGFSFSSSMCLMSNVEMPKKVGNCWKPFGLSQMLQWVHLNSSCVRDQLKSLASETQRLTTRLQDAGLYEPEEQCPYCASSVDLESAESACCRGLTPNEGQAHRCKLSRCAVSMQVCPLRPSWFCVCCHRRAFRLAPHRLFTMPHHPSDFGDAADSLSCEGVPWCPFCGVALQRAQPDLLQRDLFLTPSPV